MSIFENKDVMQYLLKFVTNKIVFSSVNKTCNKTFDRRYAKSVITKIKQKARKVIDRLVNKGGFTYKSPSFLIFKLRKSLFDETGELIDIHYKLSFTNTKYMCNSIKVHSPYRVKPQMRFREEKTRISDFFKDKHFCENILSFIIGQFGSINDKKFAAFVTSYKTYLCARVNCWSVCKCWLQHSFQWNPLNHHGDDERVMSFTEFWNQKYYILICRSRGEWFILVCRKVLPQNYETLNLGYQNYKTLIHGCYVEELLRVCCGGSTHDMNHELRNVLKIYSNR